MSNARFEPHFGITSNADDVSVIAVVSGTAAADCTGLAPIAIGATGPLAMDVNGRLITLAIGNVPAGTTDSCNPVKIGAIASADSTTGNAAVVAGQRANIAADLNGRLLAMVQGNVANAVADTGNPVKIGAQAVGTATNSSVGLGPVTAGQRTNIAADLQGRLLGVVQGDIDHDSPDTATSKPVKIGGTAIALNSQAGAAVVTANDRVQAAFDTAGRQEVLAAGDTAINVAADVGNPVGIGGIAITAGSQGAITTAGRRTAAAYNTSGALHVLTSPNPYTSGTTTFPGYTGLVPTAGDANGAIVVKASTGRLRRCTAYNNDAANALWVQIHNDAALPPVSGGRAWGSVPIPVLGFVEIDFSEADLRCATGIMLALSTTPMAYTAAAVTGEFSAQYA